MKTIFRIVLTVWLLLALTMATSATINKTSPPQVTDGFNEFAFDLFHQVNKLDENSVISPYSLSSLLAILANGAAGNTRAQFMQLFHVNDVREINAGSELIDQSLKKNNPCGSWFCCKFTRFCKWVHIGEVRPFFYANGLWADESFNYKKSFIDTINQNDSAHFFTVNFQKAPESARTTINQWVEDNTRGYIRDLIQAGGITSYTRLVLTNAIYFKGKWQFPFKQSDTKSKPFTLLNGNQVQVPIMQLQEKFSYAENESLQILLLPYANSTLMMAILLPKAQHTLKESQSTLNAATFTELIAGSQEREVKVSLPRFKFMSTFNTLDKNVQALGLIDAFTDKADFSNITHDPLFISKIIQKALIQVDEEGTVAAAATSVVMFGTAYVEPITFNADHPFTFLIFDKQSQVILFMGQVTDPR